LEIVWWGDESDTAGGPVKDPQGQRNKIFRGGREEKDQEWGVLVDEEETQ